MIPPPSEIPVREKPDDFRANAMLNDNRNSIALADADWDALQSLATRVGLPAERISLMRKRASGTDSHRDGPCTLIAGRRTGGIDLLLARWISPDAADALKAAAHSPLVIGRSPEMLQPAVGKWPVWKWADHLTGHLIALSVDGVPNSAVMGQLASIGGVEQLVLVTRLGQPLHPNERALASAMSGYAATVRVVAVAVPGEEPTDDDLAAVAAFAFSQMRDAGFRDGRCLAAGVWFTEASARRLGTIQDLEKFLTIERTSVMDGRVPMIRRQLCELMGEIKDAAGRARQSGLSISESDARSLAEKFQIYLASLGREIARTARSPRVHDDESLRSYFLDRIRSWGSYIEPEGMWLKHVEALRPGTQAAFIAEATRQSPALNYKSFVDSGISYSKTTVAADSGENDSGENDVSLANMTVDRVVLEAKRLSVALAIGVASFFLVDRIPLPLARIPSYAALVLGTILGYGAMRRLLRQDRKSRQDASYEESAETKPQTAIGSDAVNDWIAVEHHLVTWFNKLIYARPAEPIEECRRFVERLGCEEPQR